MESFNDKKQAIMLISTLEFNEGMRALDKPWRSLWNNEIRTFFFRNAI